MNLGHRLRVAEVKRLRRENAGLRKKVADLTGDEIDLTDDLVADDVDRRAVIDLRPSDSGALL